MKPLNDPYATSESEQEVKQVQPTKNANEKKISVTASSSKTAVKTANKEVMSGATPAGVSAAPKPKPLDSPDFILENMNVAKFEKAMKEKNININVKIVQSGKQHVKCANEHRETVRIWCKANGVQGTTSTCNHERQGASTGKGIHVSYKEEEVKEYL